MKKKHIPTRMCIACREMRERQKLFKLVKIDTDIVIDHLYKMDGRGTYICKDENCIKLAFAKGMLKRTLKADVDPGLETELLDFIKKAKNETIKEGKVFRLNKDGSIERL